MSVTGALSAAAIEGAYWIRPCLCWWCFPQRTCVLLAKFSSCTALTQVPSDGRRSRLAVHVNNGLSALISRIGESYERAAMPAPALGPT